MQFARKWPSATCLIPANVRHLSNSYQVRAVPQHLLRSLIDSILPLILVLVDVTEKQTVLSWFEQHREALTAAIEAHSNDVGILGSSGSKVTDVDWRLVVSVASSESDRLAATQVQVRLGVADARDAARVRHVAMEMNVAQFYAFLHELRKMKAALEAVTV